MQINKLQLINFRNYENLNIDLAPGINLFIGPNAQGKTNVLEAIYLCATGRSFRTHKDQEMIKWDQSFFKIGVNFHRKPINFHIDFLYDKKQKKIKINGLPQKKLSDLIGQLQVVLFSPEHLQLIKGGPGERRRFIDILLSQINPMYFHALQQYYKVLNQRNNLLKTTNYLSSQLNSQLEVWDSQLVEWGSRIILKRFETVGKLEGLAQKYHQTITEGDEEFTLSYRCSIAQEERNKGHLTRQYSELLEQRRKVDVLKGYTSIGPHRDDLIFLVNQIDLKNFGSQGQQRTAVLALKMAEVDLIQLESGDAPILLLDDVMSELDDRRSKFLVQSIGTKIQTLITATSVNSFLGYNYKLHRVLKGQVLDQEV